MEDDSRSINNVLIRMAGTYGESIRSVAKYFMHIILLTELEAQIHEADILCSSLSLQTKAET